MPIVIIDIVDVRARWLAEGVDRDVDVGHESVTECAPGDTGRDEGDHAAPSRPADLLDTTAVQREQIGDVAGSSGVPQTSQRSPQKTQ
jgi:hypothetical protein